MKIPCSILIFDLDGTLIDSKRDIALSVNRTFAQLGFPELPEEQIATQIGRGSEYLFKHLLAANVPENTIKELVNCFKKIYHKHLLDHTQIYPGVVQTLAHFSYIPKVIVTNKNQIFADRIVDMLGLRGHFKGVFGSEAFSTQKPDPGPILEVCKRWNVNPSDSIVIGDSQFDICAGKSAGTRTVGVLYGFSPTESFTLDTPDFIIDSADQLVEVFR